MRFDLPYIARRGPDGIKILVYACQEDFEWERAPMLEYWRKNGADTYRVTKTMGANAAINFAMHLCGHMEYLEENA